MKPLTPQRLADAMNIGLASAELWVSHVNAALSLCGCSTVEHVAQWIAQVGHESAGLTRLVESLNYSADGLTATWPTRFTPERAKQFGRTDSRIADQQAIAEIVYGGRLGNAHNGDGWRFRGVARSKLRAAQTTASAGSTSGRTWNKSRACLSCAALAQRQLHGIGASTN